jgi:hypothetical protein
MDTFKPGNVGGAAYRDRMDHLPLTAAQPWDEIAAQDMMFPVPPPDGARPVEVMVMVPEEGYRVVMHIITGEEDAERAVTLAFREGRKLPGYELTVRQF